jgi:hypothetical protein
MSGPVTLGQVPVPYWALVGKKPGTRDDYSVQRFNDPRLEEHALAGVPSTLQLGGAPGPGQLPWATFTPHTSDGQYWMAATVTDATADRDAGGRVVAAIRHAKLPFAEFARRGGRCAVLYKGLPTVAAMDNAVPGQPLYLDLNGAPDAPELTVDTARELDDPAVFNRVARLAALILAGPVLITPEEPGHLTIADRLSEFDRILALLPLGMRSSITLASWQDGTRETRFRVAFGRVPSQGQTVVGQYDDELRVPREGTPAAGYLADLLDLRERCGAGRVIRHLASHRWPLSLSRDDVAEAREILRGLSDPYLVVEAARAAREPAGRTLSADRVSVTLQSADRRLGQEAKDDLERALLAMGGSAAAQAVMSNWSARTAGLAAEVVLDELARPAEYAGLESYRWSPSLWRLRAYVAQCGEEEATDVFLAALAAPRTRGRPSLPAATIAACLDRVPPGPGELPRLRAALFRQPPVTRWLLRLAVRRDTPSTGWIYWLNPGSDDAPAWLRPYQVLTAASGACLPLPAVSGTPDSLEDLVLVGWLAVRDRSFAWLAEDWWRALIRVARGRAGRMSPDDSLAPATDRARADLGFLLSLKDLIGKTPGDLETNARIDTLRLYLGLRPAHYPLDAAREPALEYLDALWGAWSRPPADADVAMLTVWLLAAVFGGTRRYQKPAVDPLSEFSVALLRDAVSDVRVPLTSQVATALTEAVARAPRLLTDPRLTPDWWGRVEQLRPDIRTPEARLRAVLRQEDPSTDPAEIAMLAGRAALRVRGAEELAEIIGPWFARRSQPSRDALFKIIDGVVRLADAETGRSSEELLSALASRLDITEDKPGLLRRLRNTQS